MSAEAVRFAFGQNWQAFIAERFSEQTVGHAQRCLAELLEDYSLSGKSFLDIGCGSGLSSLAAQRLGAGRIVSFDYDADAVECCRQVRAAAGEPAAWQVMQGSALDRSLLERLGPFDVVYSWGVLHHTGEMWAAIENAAAAVKAGGILFLAIYNKADALGIYGDGRFGPSALWRPIKRTYCRLPLVAQNVLDYAALGLFGLACLLRGRNPAAVARRYQQDRGMSLRRDIKDWLGGYPYECAAVDEVFNFLRRRGFELVNLKCHGGLRCNEFVLRRKS